MTKMMEEITQLSLDLPPLVEETPRQEVARLLDQLVKEKGADYVYPYAQNGGIMSIDCMYVERVSEDAEPNEVWDRETESYVLDELVPSCILGHLAVRVGVPMLELASSNNDGWLSTHECFSIPSRWARDEDLIQAMTYLQEAQDTGTSWGQAVAEFKIQLDIS